MRIRTLKDKKSNKEKHLVGKLTTKHINLVTWILRTMGDPHHYSVGLPKDLKDMTYKQARDFIKEHKKYAIEVQECLNADGQYHNWETAKRLKDWRRDKIFDYKQLL